IIILCDGSDASYEIKGYEYGASDVIFKPFNETTIFHRVQTLVELSVHKNNLEVLLEEQAEVLRSSNESMVDVLSTIIEYRSIETGNHVMRIRQYTEVLLQKVMETYPEYNLTADDIASIVSAASLHDIGKISIPDSILNKPGRLTDEEFEIMKSHTTNGARILQNLNEFGDHKYLRYAYNICLYHHERWDGSGYPKGLVGDDIPICAQVVGIADVYDALTTDRVYKKAYSHNKALNMILNGECGAFSHKVLECLKRVGVDFRKIKSALDDKNYGNKDDLSVPLPAPSYQLQKVDALQMVQVKYQTLLHHVNATVLEAQLGSGVYHIVFNPNPDFYLPAFKDNLQEAINDMVYTVVHPSDRRKVIKQFADCKNILIKRGLRKYSFTFRMYVPSVGDYIPYKTTILHIKEASFENPAIMVVFEPVSTVSAAPAPSEYSKSIQTLNDVAHFHNLVGSTIICENSNAFSILYGSENLFNLVGYTPDEIETLFHNSLMELVFPEDQASLIKQIDVQLKSGNMFELEYRLKRKNGTTVWVLDKSNLIEDENGKEYFYSFLIDNSNVKNTQARLEEELLRNQLIINQSNDIVFELDVNTDHLWCSDKWEERFGHRALHDNYTENVFQHSHIHPDDMPKMREGIGKLLKGATHVDIDVRIVNSEGIYLWNQIRATSQKDAAGNITKAIGVIVDIDNEIKSIQTLQKKSERDALTGLY
ncbi:MAG: PAS domain-containing protein, partial [Firmicutes bacterium]|nr:PAS domain-containing protein [Bacillota bacterium]